jgi:plasmid stabilization system protein ParE
MIYTVIWTNAALNALADIYNRATDKAAVTAASHRLDQALRHNADQKGLDQGSFRVIEEPPLRAAFTVTPADCMVRVFWVKRI